MQYISTTYQKRPDLVEQYFALLQKVYSTDQEGQNFSTSKPKPEDPTHYIFAVEDEKVIGGIKLEITSKDHPHLLRFQRKEIFDTFKRHLPFLDNPETPYAELSHLAVDPVHQNNGIGTRLMQEAFRISKSLGSHLTLTFPNDRGSTEGFFTKVVEQGEDPSYVVAVIDLITDNWARLRNKKQFTATVHDAGVANKFELYQKGIIPWQPKAGNKTVLASAYGENRGLDAVLFDWDNTLADDTAVWASAISKTLRQLKDSGHAIPSNLRVAYAQHPKDYLTSVLGKELAETAYPMLMKYYGELLTQVSFLKPGALETLKLLRKKNIPFAIISNSREPHLSQQIKHLLEKELGTVSVFADAKKPAAEKVLEARSALGCSASSKVYLVGDSGDKDVRAALSAAASGVHLRPVLFSAADINIVNELSQEGRSAEISFVKDHADLQQLLSAQLRGQNFAAR